MDTPEQIVQHSPAFNPDAWKQYTYEELTWWVRLLTKRAKHRVPGDKRDKDLYDAGNYAAMLREFLKANFDGQPAHTVFYRAQFLEGLETVLKIEKDRTPSPQIEKA